MSDRESYENGLLTLRFIGQALNKHGVSIYDLGESLLSIQRIVHKAYLAQEDRLEKGHYPKKHEREYLALQLGERRRSSDAFALVPLLADPNTQEIIKKTIDYVLSGIVGYFTGDIIDRVRKEKDPNKQIFIGAIYADVVNITNRVGTSGGVEAISLGSPALNRETVATITPETKAYLEKIENENFLGPYQEIKGRVYKFYPASNIVSIKRSGGKTVAIHLHEKDFDEIRYKKETTPWYKFKGHPIYKFGVQTKTVTEFQASEIEYMSPKESSEE